LGVRRLAALRIDSIAKVFTCEAEQTARETPARGRR